MSLLREAERCLANFQKFNKSLNAFINGVRDERTLLDRVKESDIRHESGMFEYFFRANGEWRMANNVLILQSKEIQDHQSRVDWLPLKTISAHWIMQPHVPRES